MQVKTNPNVVSNTLPNTTQYSIKASAKAFKILSDGLYSDKIAAPIRELSTNAYDAHVANNNTTTPFDVHLPSVAEPWFAIRDYGIGMSKQELQTTYTTYFDSNKTHSNDFVGCMGLGSKTPFTLSDAFTVTSVKDGKKTTVINYLDADVPNFSIISEENTDEASGTEIKFTPTEANTYDKLRESAQRILGYFDVTPNLTIGSTKEEVKVPTKRLEGKDWYYVDSQLAYSDSIILMGNVAYPFNFSDVSDDFEKKYGWSNTYEYRRLVSNLVFRVPIGNLDITASREEIGWTSEGREYMVNFVERVNNEIKDIMNEQLNECENFWDARILFNSMIGYNEEYYSDIDRNGSGSIGHFKWTEQLSWNGINVSERYGDVFKNPNLQKMEYRLFWLGSPKRNRYHGADKVNRRSDVNGIIPFDADVEFFQNDLPTGSVSRVNHYVRENKNKVVLMFNEFTNKERKYLKLIGYPNKIRVTSELEKPPSNRNTSTTTKDNVIAYEKTDDYGWNPAGNWSSEEEIALNTKDTIYYVPIRNWKIYFHDSEYSNTCKLDTLLGKVIEQDDVKIYGIKYAQTKKLAKYKNFKNVFDVISDYIESSFKTKTGSLYQSVMARKFYHFKHEGSYKVVNNLLNNRVFKRVCVLLKESNNTDTIKELMKIRRIININNHSEKSVSEKDSQLSHNFENFARYTNIHCERNLYSYFTSKVSYTLKNIPHMLSQEYPMVRFMGGALDGSGSYTNSMENLIEYMELVNSTKK
jgi:hypothetical protein